MVPGSGVPTNSDRPHRVLEPLQRKLGRLAVRVEDLGLGRNLRSEHGQQDEDKRDEQELEDEEEEACKACIASSTSATNCSTSPSSRASSNSPQSSSNSDCKANP